jgi:hypothetical protein
MFFTLEEGFGLKLSRTSGPVGPGAPQPSQEGPQPPGTGPASHSRLGGTGPAETLFTQARPGSPLATPLGTGPIAQLRQDAPSVLRARPESRASELAARLEAAPPEVKGSELARLHGQAALRRVQRLLAPRVERLATGRMPARRGALQPPPAAALDEAQTAALRSAAALAAEALRVEGYGRERLSTEAAGKFLDQLDRVQVDRSFDPGPDGLGSAAQRVFAALAP